MKRKRLSDSTGPKKCHAANNPFLELQKEAYPAREQVNHEQQHVLSKVLAFSTASRSEADAKLLRSNVVFLVEYLERQQSVDSSTPGSLLSPTDVADMLLQWAVKCLLYASSSSHHGQTSESILLYFTTLRSSLKVLLSAGGSSQVVSTCLSQSTLNKLVPYAAQQAALLDKNDDENESSSRNDAAACYCLLVEKLYRPTLDSAGRSLLPLVDDHHATCVQILESTLHLLHVLQKSSNPKKTFQLLADTSVLSVLSRWRLVSDGSAVRDLLWEGLFSPLHHVEGFRSMNLKVPSDDEQVEKASEETKKRTFHCYQETLLRSIATLLGEVDDENTEANTKDQVVPTARLIPELLRGFIEQNAVWERNHGGKIKKKGATFSASVQFRLWSHLIWPIVTRLQTLVTTKDKSRVTSDDSTLFMTRAIRETLLLVLQHDIYLPSYRDSVQFGFLNTLATLLLDLLGAPLKTSRDVESECLQGLETLISLNHLVAHERLAQLLSACALVQDGVEIHQTALLCTVIKTYHKLRQMDHLIQALLDVTEDCDGKKSQVLSVGPLETDRAVSSLKALILEKNVHAEFAAAVRGCPPGQIHDLFHKVNQWMRQCTDSLNQNNVSFVVTLFVLLIRNVCVDRHTAASVAALCDETIESTARTLMERPDSIDLRREVLVLSGWLLDLRTRCAFWLEDAETEGKENRFNIVAVIMKELGFVATGNQDIMKLTDAYGSMLNEIQFLLCHRIRELHSCIHEAQRAAWTKEAGATQDGSTLLEEAQRLVRFVVSIAENAATESDQSDVTASGSRWTLLAETAPYWVPYAESRHVDSFLTWMFSTLAVNDEKEISQEADVIPSHVFAEEKTVVQALLRDSSFFEISELSSRFHEVGVKCVMALLSDALPRKDGDDKETQKRIDFNGVELTAASKDFSFRPVSLIQLGEALSMASPKESQKILRGRKIRADLVSRALRIVRLLNGSPRELKRIRFDVAMRLDILACIIAFKSTKLDLEAVVLPLICAIRSYTASSVVDMNNLTEDNQEVSCVLHGLFDSTIDLMKHSAALDCGLQRALLRGSGALVESITVSCLSSFEESSELAKTLFACFTDLLIDMDEAEHDHIKWRVQLNLTKSFVKRLAILMHRDATLHGDNFNQKVIMPFIEDVCDKLGKLITTEETLLHEENLLAERFVLLGDITYLSALVTSTQPDVVDPTIITRALDCEMKEVPRRAIDYYLACVAASAHPPCPVSEQVFHRCVSGEARNHLMDATFCRLVHGMGTGEVRDLLSNLLKSTQSEGDCRLRALRLFQLTIEQVESDQQRMELTRVARTFFTRIVGLLHPCDGKDTLAWTEEVDLGVSLLIALTQKKEVLAVRERDLALMLAQVAATLGEGGSFHTPDAPSVDSRVYSSSFMLVSSLLQRFPKQLYACVPSVVSTLHVLLRHALYGVLPEPEVTRRAQMFTRLCELLIPHRDVYKKHVLGLILEFVGALRSDVHPSRSKCLVPAIYCLLDILSQYETEQLNTFMDATAKALFRTVYQSHQKTHMYKGQY